MIKDFTRGDTKSYGLSFKDSTGAPLSLFGRTIWMTFKSDMALPDSQAEIALTVAPPDDVNSANGLYSLVLTSEMTNIPPGNYFYDIQIVTPGSPPHVLTVLQGQVVVLDDVTKNNV